MNRKLQICAWCGFAAMPFVFVSMWPMWHMLPPIAPSHTAAETARHYREHSMGILGGAVLQVVGLSLLFVFSGGLTACLRKIEGTFTAFTDGFIMLVPLSYVTILVTSVLFSALAFRPDWPDQTMQLISDIALIMLVWPGVIGTAMYALVGFVILGDRNPLPIFPRWLGYLSIWVALLLAPGNAVTFFKTGPFAWDGLLGFWIPAITFGLLINLIAWAMLGAARHPAIAPI